MIRSPPPRRPRPRLQQASLGVLASATLVHGAAARPLQDAQAASDHGDYARAVGLLRPLADQGDPAAQGKLAGLEALGLGVPADAAQALVLARRSFAAGSAEGAAVLVEICSLQLGGTAGDCTKAADFYRARAQGGDVTAVDSLASLYDEGKEVPRDETEAFRWYLKAAQAGDYNAQAKVGSAYALGKGAPHDPALAYAWLDLAVATAKDGAKENLDDVALARDAAAADLTAADKVRARSLIKTQLARQAADP
jgi:TPR repeat protein